MSGSHANPYADGDRYDDTPFRRARQEWDNRIGSAVVQAKNWRLAFFMACSGLLLSLGGSIYISTLPRQIPFIIEVDRDGPALVRGEIGSEATRFTPTDLQVRHYVRTFVSAVRRVSTDAAVVKRDQTQAYSLVSERAHDQLRGYFRTVGDPVKRASAGAIQVEIPSAIKVTDSTWQLDWIERHWEPQRAEPKETRWRGLFRVQLRPPTAVDPDNPIGLYIDEFHWDQVR